METSYEPKIGDLVVITKSDKNWSPHGYMDQFVGTIQKISGIEHDNQGDYYHFVDTEQNFVDPYSINSWYWRYNCGHFRKLNKDEKTIKLKLKF